MIEELRKHLADNGLTQKKIAETLGTSEQYVNALVLGKRNFGKKTAKIWEDCLGISSVWLMTGAGPMMVDKQKHVNNIDINVSKNTGIIAGHDVNSSNVGQDSCKDELEKAKKRLDEAEKLIEELKRDKKQLQDMIDYIMKKDL